MRSLIATIGNAIGNSRAANAAAARANNSRTTVGLRKRGSQQIRRRGWRKDCRLNRAIGDPKRKDEIFAILGSHCHTERYVPEASAGRRESGKRAVG
jgi:hypothetical protein